MISHRVMRAARRLRDAEARAVKATVRYYDAWVAADLTHESAIMKAGAAVVSARAALDRAKAATRRAGRVRK